MEHSTKKSLFKVSAPKLKASHLVAGALLAAAAMPGAAQAGGKYYNCATNQGCTLVKSKTFTSSYTKTKNPIVLAHGLGGWSRMFKVVDYFHGIPKELIKGGSQVYSTKVSATHNSEFRGEQLLQQVKVVSALNGYKPVNLVGHSQGGIDIRYVAGTAPSYVASVTAVSSPEQGSTTADWALDNITGGNASDGYNPDNINVKSKIIMAVMNMIGVVADVGSGVDLSNIQDQDGWEAANGLTSVWLNQFNSKFPAGMPSYYCGYPSGKYYNGIPYYSFSGVAQVTRVADPLDLPMKLTSLTFNGDPNDGLVSACSSRLGQVIRDDYKMNHADSINQTLGLTSLLETDPVSVYRSQINRLKTSEGL